MLKAFWHFMGADSPYADALLPMSSTHQKELCVILQRDCIPPNPVHTECTCLN